MPISPTITTSKTYEISITTYCGTSTDAGLVFNNAGTFSC